MKRRKSRDYQVNEPVMLYQAGKTEDAWQVSPEDVPYSAIRAGLPVETIDNLSRQLDVSPTRIAEVADIPPSTLSRRRKEGAPLTAAESDRVYRIARVFALARDTFENTGLAADWLQRSQFEFQGSSPLDLLDTEVGARLVEKLLYKIEEGAPV